MSIVQQQAFNGRIDNILNASIVGEPFLPGDPLFVGTLVRNNYVSLHIEHEGGQTWLTEKRP